MVACVIGCTWPEGNKVHKNEDWLCAEATAVRKNLLNPCNISQMPCPGTVLVNPFVKGANPYSVQYGLEEECLLQNYPMGLAEAMEWFLVSFTYNRVLQPFGCFLPIGTVLTIWLFCVMLQSHSLVGWAAEKAKGLNNPGFLCTMHQKDLYQFDQFNANDGGWGNGGTPLDQDVLQSKIVPIIKQHFQSAVEQDQPAKRVGFYINGSMRTASGVASASYNWEEDAKAVADKQQEAKAAEVAKSVAQAQLKAQEAQRLADEAKAAALAAEAAAAPAAPAAVAAAAPAAPAEPAAAKPVEPAADKEDAKMADADPGANSGK